MDYTAISNASLKATRSLVPPVSVAFPAPAPAAAMLLGTVAVCPAIKRLLLLPTLAALCCAFAVAPAALFQPLPSCCAVSPGAAPALLLLAPVDK